MSGRNLDTKETSKQKPNKQREPLQKWQEQQIKIPVVNWTETHTAQKSSREIPRYIFAIF